MYELIILVLLVVVIVLSLRPGRPVQPLVVHSPGRFHLTLAPDLAPEQSYLERIADIYLSKPLSASDLPALYCSVTPEYQDDKRRQPYLLAIALRRGTVYCQAIATPPGQHDPAIRLQALRAFSDAVLVELPVVAPSDANGIAVLRGAVEQAASESARTLEILS